jgi:hypothetical protein
MVTMEDIVNANSEEELSYLMGRAYKEVLLDDEYHIKTALFATTQYNDLIYDPSTGSRQYRLFMKAFTTTEWNGQLNAQGFILNLNNVQAWQSYQKYTKGEIVLYKNTYWQALSIVQPQETFNYNEWVKSNYQLIISILKKIQTYIITFNGTNC